MIKPLPRPGPLGSAEFRLTFPGADSEIDPGDLRISVLYGHRLLLMVASVLADQFGDLCFDVVGKGSAVFNVTGEFLDCHRPRMH